MFWENSGNTNPTTVPDIYSSATTSLNDLYRSALSRFTAKQKQAGTEFTGAENALTDVTKMFQPGGTYGAGQKALIEQQRQGQLGEAAANLVSTGMSSGTNAAGVARGINRNANNALLGVEDTRTNQLASAMSNLANLKLSVGGYVGSTQEPDYQKFYNPGANTYMGQMGETGRQQMGQSTTTTKGGYDPYAPYNSFFSGYPLS